MDGRDGRERGEDGYARRKEGCREGLRMTLRGGAG